MPDCSVALGGDRALIPDFAIIDEPGFEGVILSAEHHVLVGEIASPSTRVYDRTTKRALYAEAGVPFLMLVEPKPPSAVLYELRDGEYAEIARSAGGRIELIRPFPVVLDLRERRR
jgi:Uma2 family endonuclease